MIPAGYPFAGPVVAPVRPWPLPSWASVFESGDTQVREPLSGPVVRLNLDQETSKWLTTRGAGPFSSTL